jgi:hypothetical protein
MEPSSIVGRFFLSKLDLMFSNICSLDTPAKTNSVFLKTIGQYDRVQLAQKNSWEPSVLGSNQHRVNMESGAALRAKAISAFRSIRY